MRCELEASEPDRSLASSQKSLILLVLQRLAKFPERTYGLHQLSNSDAMNEILLQIQLIEPAEKSFFLIEYHSQKGGSLVHYDWLLGKFHIEIAYLIE